ncbi:MAG: SPOR domain-containing protein [Halomonas sp.]
MKYGMRERLSGAVILIALAVIFVPMLFDEPAPRSERPEPTQRIEPPIEVERHDVPEPVPPASLDADEEVSEVQEAAEVAPIEPVPDDAAEASAEAGDEASSDAALDPIAELARAADERMARSSGDESDTDAGAEGEAAASGGDWAVQVGSFGQADNAERLLGQLREEGFDAFTRPRDDDLTTVYVGPFGSAEEGERAVAEVKSRANLQGLLVRVRE